MRWKISYDPHAVGTDRGDPRDAGEAYACQRVPVLLSYRIMNDEINHQSLWPVVFLYPFLRSFCMKLIEYRGEVLSEYVPDLPEKEPEGAVKCCALF